MHAFVGKTLLTGKDVTADFLQHKGASRIKALVGGDLLQCEKKGGVKKKVVATETAAKPTKIEAKKEPAADKGAKTGEVVALDAFRKK